MMTPSENLVLIAALTSAIVSIINAIGQFWGRKEGRARTKEQHQEISAKLSTVDTKVDEVHTLANGNLEKLNQQLAAARQQIAHLERAIAEGLKT